MRKETRTLAAVSGATALALAMTLGAPAAFAQQSGTQTSSGTVLNATGTGTNADITLLTSNDLTVGSTGQAVVELQGILAELGYLHVPAGTTLGYFGELTKGALARYQQAVGVPATGYFGPMTRTALATHFSQRGWMDSLTGSTTSTGQRQSTDPSVQSGTSGYWYNGTWYTTIQSVTDVMGTSTATTSSPTNTSGVATTTSSEATPPTSSPTANGSWSYDQSTNSWIWNDASNILQ